MTGMGTPAMRAVLAEPERVKKAAASILETRGVFLTHGNALDLYDRWPTPTVIFSDGAYGVSGFPTDTETAEGLTDWYAPHVAAWTRNARPFTTLWFWNTELGWATVHPLLVAAGWKYVNCHIWNKGKGHIAGNANTKTLRKFPVVTEVCVQYVLEPTFQVDGREAQTKEWLRHEWRRTGLPQRLANEACGVIDAATRKYLTQCHLWYFPPPEIFQKMVDYANKNGDPSGRPYFSVDGRRSLTAKQWERYRSKFYCEFGVTNVWDHPAVRGDERLKNGTKALHLNQKPLEIVDRIIRASSDPGDVVWEPFGGLCSAAVASLRLDRKCYAAELEGDFYEAARARLKAEATRERPLEEFRVNGREQASLPR